MWRAVIGVTVASALAAVAIYFAYPVERLRLPRGVALTDLLLLLAFVAGSRLAARTFIERPARGDLLAHGKEVLIVGAGDAGRLVLNELQKSRQLGLTPIGLVDDDPRKRNMRLHGVRVLGSTDDLPRLLHENRPDEVIIAIPSASGDVRRKVVETARAKASRSARCPACTSSSPATSTSPASCARCRSRTCSAARPVEVDLDAIASYVARPHGARHRRGRLDRLGALPPDRAPGRPPR